MLHVGAIAATTESAALPNPRGPLTQVLFDTLRSSAGSVRDSLATASLTDDPLYGEDAPLALYALYELHYRGFVDVDDGWEWDPGALHLRGRLERAFLHRLRAEVDATFGSDPIAPHDVAPQLKKLTTGDGPSVSAFLAERGTLEHVRDFAVHRSIYQLKEADPHTWAIPRLRGAAKAALVEIQFDEYGSGREHAMHSALFADTLHALGLSPKYGAYLDVVPGATLATVNLISVFGLHRRWRGALVGHLAMFEMCSVVPMQRYVAALERLGVPDATPFYTAHVVADEWHQVLALEKMVGCLVSDEPHLSDDIVFGARALDHLERAVARRLLDAWERGVPSLHTRCA